MQTDEDKREAMKTRTSSAIIFLAGVWLLLSPFFFNYSSGGLRGDQVVFGAIIAILGIVRYFDLRAAWASWLSALAGLWMIIAPYAISGATTAARWSSMVGGLIVLAFSLAIANSSTEQSRMQHHGGHPAM